MSYTPLRVFLPIGSLGLSLACILLPAMARAAWTVQAESRAATYFVDCAGEARKGDGRSADSPWTNLEQVNAHVFGSGEEVRFQRGSVCHGTLWPKGSGSESAPIRMTAYGTGKRPKIVAEPKNDAVLKLFNQEYWNIDSVDLSGANTFGVLVSGDQGILHHIHLANLLVHDIGGAEMKHKESGLVVISPGSVDQRFDDVLVDGVTAYNTQEWVGIMVGGGNFGYPPESTWSTHVIIRDSTVHDVQGDGIVLFRVRDGRISSNVAWNTGMQPTENMGTPNAIWTWMCRDCVVEQNEAFLSDSPGVDGGAFDIDYGNTNNSVIDNYGHDTQGYCIAVFAAGFVTQGSQVRGNTCLNNARSPRMAEFQGAIFLHTWNDGKLDGLVVEDNTVYWNPPATAPAVMNDAVFQGEGLFKNNRIYSTSPWMITSNHSLRLEENLYILSSQDGSLDGKWKYGERLFHGFAAYQTSSGQDLGGSFHGVAAKNTDAPFWPEASAPTLDRPYRELLAKPLIGLDDGVRLPQQLGGNWTIYAMLSGTLDASGLLDEKNRKQLTVVTSLAAQFHGNGLRTVIAMGAGTGGDLGRRALANAISDLNLAGVALVAASAIQGHDSAEPLLLLLSPARQVIRAWRGGAGAAELGIAVRQRLGSPLYSQIGETN
jgi:Right handed beta helix region